jgi:hypothetical protein
MLGKGWGAVWGIGGLAAVTFLAGVTAVATWNGSSASEHAAAAAASPTTVAAPADTTTAPTAAPAVTTTSLVTSPTVTAAPRPVSTTTTIPPVGSIVGTVTHKNGAPVVGAKVTLDGSHGGTVATDDAGRYAFNDLPPGQYDLSMYAQGPPAKCQPQQPCLAPAVAMEERPVALQPGERHTEDWVYPYDEPPSYN